MSDKKTTIENEIEEIMAQLYKEEMQKPVDKRNEWLIRQCIPCAVMFENTAEGKEKYRKHFGKPREEYERL